MATNESQINWAAANYKFMMRPQPRIEPIIDEVVSQIVGKKIYQSDPRLLKLIIKWKAGKPQNSLEPDDFLKDEKKIAELKEVLNKPF
jgi:hypothetical protein